MAIAFISGTKGIACNMQKKPEERDETGCIFSSLVLLQFVANISEKKPVVLWDNPYSGSPLGVTPLRTW